MKKVRKYTPDEDAPLLASWQRGEIISFETLIWKYQKRIYNLSYLLTGDPESSAEAVQSAFVSAYREIGSLRSTSRFSTWLAALAIKESRKLLDFKETPPPPASAIYVTSGRIPDQLPGESQPVQDDLRGKIAALPPELGEVIVLRYVRGYSLERVEEILQIRSESLTSRLFDAQEMLAAQMKQREGQSFKGLPLKKEDTLPHPEIRHTLPVYLDNAADEEERDLIRKHLGGCGSCREALAELEWMVEHLRSIPDIEPPHWLTATIMTKISSVGANEPMQPKRSLPTLLPPFLLSFFVLTLLGTAWYFLARKAPDIPQERSPAAAANNRPLIPAPEGRASQALSSLFSGSLPFRMSRGRPEPPAGTVQPASPAPQPESSPPYSETESMTPLQQKPAPPPAGLKPDTTVKKTRSEAPPQLPQEWGESLPSSRISPRMAPIQKSRGNEVAVLLEIEDPSGSVQEIEQSVIGLGGRITGRAYSSGNDILYTRIEPDKFYELMKRLGKIGKLLELPQVPEEAAGSIDLVIRW